jgi:hypothetical protein
LVVLISSAALVFAAVYVAYRLVDPLPPRHLVIAAGATGTGYDKLARRYAKILARHGVDLEIRNSAGAVGDLVEAVAIGSVDTGVDDSLGDCASAPARSSTHCRDSSRARGAGTSSGYARYE